MRYVSQGETNVSSSIATPNLQFTILDMDFSELKMSVKAGVWNGNVFIDIYMKKVI